VRARNDVCVFVCVRIFCMSLCLSLCVCERVCHLQVRARLRFLAVLLTVAQRSVRCVLVHTACPCMCVHLAHISLHHRPGPCQRALPLRPRPVVAGVRPRAACAGRHGRRRCREPAGAAGAVRVGAASHRRRSRPRRVSSAHVVGASPTGVAPGAARVGHPWSPALRSWYDLATACCGVGDGVRAVG
jgi:hypothetical protein